MSKVHVKTDDTVLVLSGKSRGVTGKVIAVSPKEGKVIVEGANKIVKHVKPRKMGETGGLINSEGAMYASKVKLVCPKCGEPTRVGHTIVDDKKLRVCKKCKETFE
jgi:large subunit ribosomal protein L24